MMEVLPAVSRFLALLALGLCLGGCGQGSSVGDLVDDVRALSTDTDLLHPESIERQLRIQLSQLGARNPPLHFFAGQVNRATYQAQISYRLRERDDAGGFADLVMRVSGTCTTLDDFSRVFGAGYSRDGRGIRRAWESRELIIDYEFSEWPYRTLSLGFQGYRCVQTVRVRQSDDPPRRAAVRAGSQTSP